MVVLKRHESNEVNYEANFKEANSKISEQQKEIDSLKRIIESVKNNEIDFLRTIKKEVDTAGYGEGISFNIGAISRILERRIGVKNLNIGLDRIVQEKENNIE